MERDHNGNKASKLFLLCNPYHRLLAVKDIVSFSLVFFIFETVYCKTIDGKIYFLTYSECWTSVDFEDDRSTMKMIGQIFSCLCSSKFLWNEIYFNLSENEQTI